jgi:segregation and condensation protein A
VRKERTLSFEKLFEICHDRLQAIFLFLSMLELVQLNYMNILIGEGRNNFIVEYNPDKPEDPEVDATLLGSPAPDDNDPIGDDDGSLFPSYLN